MNNHPVAHPVALNHAFSGNFTADEKPGLSFYANTLIQNRWLVCLIASGIIFLGVLYAFCAKPVYEASLLIHVEEKGQREPKNILGEAGSMIDMKTPATAEIELLRSRMVLTRAIDKLGIAIQIEPDRFPLVGTWIANTNLDTWFPELRGAGGYAWGDEKLTLQKFEVPAALENRPFTFELQENGKIKVSEPVSRTEFFANNKSWSRYDTSYGPINLQIGNLIAHQGTRFLVTKKSRLALIESVQKALTVTEIGKQSGVISAVLKGENPTYVHNVLSEIGTQYLAQNTSRRTEEADKSLAYLNKKLPELKQQLEQSEARYNRFRNAHGTVDLGEEAKINLQRTATARTKRIELEQKRAELMARYTVHHPAVQSMDAQIRDIDREMTEATTQIRLLPVIEQELVRLSRDVKTNSELYAALLASAQQLQLIAIGKTSNVRLIDPPIKPEQAVSPNRPRIIAASIFLGIFLGIMLTFLHRSLQNTIDEAEQIEKIFGLPIYASIPRSKKQETLEGRTNYFSGLPLLAKIDSADPTVESLRSLRAALQFSMAQAKNNIVLITGPTAGLGKSFISANLATVMAASGRKILLIDADLRNGHLHQYFNCTREHGLTEALTHGDKSKTYVNHNVIENLDFISTGKLPLNPSELLLRLDTSGYLQNVSKNYDMVLIDCSPILATADSLIVGAHAGLIYLVGRAGVTTSNDIAESLKRLVRAGLSPRGVLFNDISLRASRYGYRYELPRQITYTSDQHGERGNAVSI